MTIYLVPGEVSAKAYPFVRVAAGPWECARGCNEFAGDPPSRAGPPSGPILPLVSLPLQSLAGDPPSLRFGVASTPATTDHQSTLAGELARFSREVPHNRFPVAPTDEAAVSDLVALVSGLLLAEL
jgi:hypothetical protein